MFGLFRPEPTMVDADRALKGRTTPVLAMPAFHRITGDPLDREFEGAETAYLGLGCFWGAEKLFWQTPGVLSTAVGYMGGYTPNPTYEEVCSGQTGHAEVVRIVFDPSVISFERLLRVFYENHNPTTANRQGNDIGTQYRSAIYTTSDEQARVAQAVTDEFNPEFQKSGFGEITTEIVPAGEWFYAEDYHQQYLDANPNGYCPIHATGVTCG